MYYKNLIKMIHHILAFLFFIPISFVDIFSNHLYYNPISLKWKYFGNKKDISVKLINIPDKIDIFFNICICFMSIITIICIIIFVMLFFKVIFTMLITFSILWLIFNSADEILKYSSIFKNDIKK